MRDESPLPEPELVLPEPESSERLVTTVPSLEPLLPDPESPLPVEPDPE
jgi:hypothetical protein